VDAELVEHAHHNVIDDLFDRLRMIVESRHGRKDHHAHARQLQHVLEVNLAEWSLAHHQHQLAPFLQDYVGGAMDQMLALPRRDRCQAAHAARRDHHSIGEK
jgi:hypothetical protein